MKHWKKVAVPLMLAAADVALTADEVACIDTELDGMDFEVFGGYATK